MMKTSLILMKTGVSNHQSILQIFLKKDLNNKKWNQRRKRMRMMRKIKVMMNLIE